MLQRRKRVGAAVLGSLAVAGLALSQTGPVHADPAPQHDDVVGVGSDIVQSSVNFLADGFNALPGYNTAGNKNRVFNFDAGADANGRNAYLDPAVGTGVLNPTVVLRAGTGPVQRPNGGGKGITAFIQDGDPTAGNRISYVRTPNLLTTKQVADAASNGVGKTHTIQFAEDYQYIATATKTNAPGHFTNAELTAIYTGVAKTWKELKEQFPADTAGWTPPADADTDDNPATPDAPVEIYPLIPQNGAGVQQVFLKPLGLWNSTASGPSDAVLLGPNGFVHQVQQNDPSTITSLKDGQKENAIVPIPQGRDALLGSGYFSNPITAYNSKALAAPLTNAGINLQKDANAFKATIPYYIVFRESDLKSTKGWQPGSTLNWVQTLFLADIYDSNGDKTGHWDPTADDNTVPPPFVASPAGVAILTAIGLTPKYVDLGVDAHS